MLLNVVLPLYSISEAGIHWYKTCHGYRMKDLHPTPSVHYPCFKYNIICMAIKNSNPDVPKVMCYLQSEDTAYVQKDPFARLESEFKNRFDTKPAVCLADRCKIKFSGLILQNNN